MNDITQIILAAATAIGLIAAAIGYVIRQTGTAKAKAIEAEGEANAKAIVTRAETEHVKAETTGRFLSLHEADQKKVDSMVADVRDEMKQCRADRIEQAATIAKLQATNTEQASMIEKLTERVAELERSRDSLRVELHEMRRAVDSGGAYPIPKGREP